MTNLNKCKEALWEKVREYNNLSHMYSEMADALTKVAQELDED